ncbi:hypothetical protein G6514_008455 [Epicoccum nigrum]|nr:hypothetical protein G6514_008455 [Epicoccum nigrum]
MPCIYATLRRVIPGPDDDFKFHESRGALPAFIRLQRQVSYLRDKDTVNGLMKHIGDEEINRGFLGMLWDDRTSEDIPYVPFSEWTDTGIDSAFKDLIRGLNSLDPAQRLTARQALKHAWFEDTEFAGQ